MTHAITAPDARPIPRRSIAQGLAAAMAACELATAFFIEVPAAAVAFAALFGVAWALLRRGARGGWALLGLLSAVELAFLPAYEREDLAHWISQGAFLVLSIAALLLVLAQHHARRRT
jgi:hypothetical protein